MVDEICCGQSGVLYFHTADVAFCASFVRAQCEVTLEVMTNGPAAAGEVTALIFS